MIKNFFARSLIMTSDGSHSFKMHDCDEHFHSYNGAYTESMHVFIQNGLIEVYKRQNSAIILEVGFGTGLNAILTMEKAEETKKPVDYTAIEPYPLSEKEYSSLNYTQLVRFNNATSLFKKMHCMNFNVQELLAPYFVFSKLNNEIEQLELPTNYFDLIYFDAFAPDIQPGLWSIEIFQKIFNALKDQGLLITYSAKGEVRRNLKKAGFLIERLSGPIGKREITRARKVVL